MTKQRVFLTGATGAMGFLTLQTLLEEGEVSLAVLALDEPHSREKLSPYQGRADLDILWGDLRDYASVREGTRGADMVLHVGALVSPAADYRPRDAMAVNYGAAVNLVRAIGELGQAGRTRLVFIGSVAETGDRMPPIHWGRVGDPIKPSVYDYYAVSKVAAERHIVESGLPGWVVLRQTGMMGPAMAATDDAIIFHNGLDNVLEYVSDRDSARLLRNLCRREREGALGEDFWGHIFNIGGGAACRASAWTLYSQVFARIGITDLARVMDAKWCATRNFHGQYYLDSDRLNDLLDFRRDGMDYFYDAYMDRLGTLAPVARALTRLPGGQGLIGRVIKGRFRKNALGEHGTLRFIQQDMEAHIAAFWGSRQAWEALPPMDRFEPFADWDRVVPIDHGYDEDQPEAALGLADMKEAARFRGGRCLSGGMEAGDWAGKLRFSCAFGHGFEASPRLVLEGGHWCPVCERESWNYYERARVDPFFAQVWDPLHPKEEKPWRYPKIVTELDV